jgi:hypothetical protein
MKLMNSVWHQMQPHVTDMWVSPTDSTTSSQLTMQGTRKVLQYGATDGRTVWQVQACWERLKPALRPTGRPLRVSCSWTVAVKRARNVISVINGIPGNFALQICTRFECWSVFGGNGSCAGRWMSSSYDHIQVVSGVPERELQSGRCSKVRTPSLVCHGGEHRCYQQENLLRAWDDECAQILEETWKSWFDD